MTEDTLVKALADVRQRRAELQAEHDRIGAELAKLKQAEKALAAIVEGAPLDAGSASPEGDGQARGPRASGRGPRGPRANSAKGRLKTLLNEAGPQGLTQAEIVRRLPDVSPATLNAYLSGMTSGGEVVRSGDFYRSERAAGADDAADDGGLDEAGGAGAQGGDAG